MNREEAKELLPIIQAFAEGKIIQFKKKEDNEWTDFLEGGIILSPCYDYRIKPEPKYRPFKTQEECWQEMHKHPDFGWIVYDKIRHSSCDVTPDEITILYECDSLGIDFKTGLREVTFTDGKPFGIKEE